MEQKRGSQDRGVLNARLNRNNPNIRQARRNNKKPRKQAPTTQQAQPPQQVIPQSRPKTPNVKLDERVERMRQPSPSPAPAPPTPVEATTPFFQPPDMPTIMDYDPKTRAMIMAATYKLWLENPSILDGLG